jgi:hypothetical protein
VLFRGYEERRVTLRSAVTPGAVTCAPPPTSSCPFGQDVVASRTVPGSGFGAVAFWLPRVMFVVASVPGSPCLP